MNIPDLSQTRRKLRQCVVLLLDKHAIEYSMTTAGELLFLYKGVTTDTRCMLANELAALVLELILNLQGGAANEGAV